MAEPSKQTTPKPKQTKPIRPAHLADGRWLADLGKLSAAEARLVACCRTGEPWFPKGWDWETPVRPAADAKTPANTIRASLIRFLVLGGDADHPVHENGVAVGGAWIEGALTLRYCRTVLRLTLKYCHFAERPNFMNAHLPELVLSGSWMPGLRGDGLTVMGSVFLREGFEAAGAVRLLGANIGGDLTCSGGTFVNPKGDALSADGIRVTRDVFLRDGFKAAGEVRLLGAQIGGDLACSGGTFSNPKGNALSADGIRVTGSVFFAQGQCEGGDLAYLG